MSDLGIHAVSPAAVRPRFLLVGALGSGMQALAEILSDAGCAVTGTDQSQAPCVGQPDVRDLRFDFCVHSPAVPSSDATLTAVRRHGSRILSLPEAINLVFQNHQKICVSGTHGKSTTTGVLSWILHHSRVSDSFFVGARLRNHGRSGAYSPGKYSIVESCEYRRSFCHLDPHAAVLTGIDNDHFDCFSHASDEVHAFREFLGRVPADGFAVLNRDCPRTMQLAEELSTRIVCYSGKATDCGSAEWTTNAITSSVLGTQFCCLRNGQKFCQISSRLHGHHNVENVLAAVVSAVELGISAEQIQAAVAAFRGIRRRFEIRGEFRGMTLIDDFAHHPTAIRSTLACARQLYNNRRLIVVFEPHQILRLQRLFSQFTKSLLVADDVLVLPAVPAREQATRMECSAVSGKLVRAINLAGRKAFLFPNLDQVISRIDDSGRPGDVVLSMGAGRTYEIHDELIRRIQRHSAA